MPIAPNELEDLLRRDFPEAKIEIIDTAGDQDHYSVTITDSSFNNKSKIEQHKMVNKTLKNILGTTLHAMQLQTKTI